MNRAVFLDRDGVLNRAIVRDGKPYPPASLEELEIPAEVAPALRILRQKRYLLIAVTNQPDVARGVITRKAAEDTNRQLRRILHLDAVLSCYHDDHDLCACRKPKPGMLLAAAAEFRTDLPASFMIGDRWRDMEAGQQAGCSTCFVDQGYAEKQPSSYSFKVRSLLEAAERIGCTDD